MQTHSTGIIETLLSLPIFQAEWVLWLLMALSVVSIAIMIERWVFYRRHTINVDKVKDELLANLSAGNFDAAAKQLSRYDSLETNVVLFGLKSHAMGPEAVQDLLAGATGREQARYDSRLNVLATIASNAPFVGLFGTVLGIIHAFNDLAGNMSEASSSVMSGIAEALIATAVGLLVAIPAVVAFNVFKSKVRKFSDNLGLLASVLTASLKASPAALEGAKE